MEDLWMQSSPLHATRLYGGNSYGEKRLNYIQLSSCKREGRCISEFLVRSNVLEVIHFSFENFGVRAHWLLFTSGYTPIGRATVVWRCVCRVETDYPDVQGPIAKWLRHCAHNAAIRGSNPCRPTKNYYTWGEFLVDTGGYLARIHTPPPILKVCLIERVARCEGDKFLPRSSVQSDNMIDSTIRKIV